MQASTRIIQLKNYCPSCNRRGTVFKQGVAAHGLQKKKLKLRYIFHLIFLNKDNFLNKDDFAKKKVVDMRQRAHTESTSLEDGMSHMTEGTLPKKRKKTARRHRRNFLQYRGSVKFFWSRCFFLSLSFFSSLLLLLLLLSFLLEKSSTSIEKFDGPKKFHPDRKKFDLDSIRPPSSHGWIRVGINARGTTGGRPSPRPVCYCPIARGGAHP